MPRFTTKWSDEHNGYVVIDVRTREVKGESHPTPDAARAAAATLDAAQSDAK
jgi:hypothetical protein